MRGYTDKETDAATDLDPDFGTRRSNDPQRDRQLAHKAGCIHLATVQTAATTRIQQRMRQAGIRCSCNGAHAMLACRAPRPSQRWREKPYSDIPIP